MSKTTTKRTVLNWRNSVSIVSLIAASAFGATATAQTAEFDIEAGNAADALNAFARQADRDVVYAFDAVEGIQVSGLEGTYDINAALNLLLTDTGLEIAGEQNGAIAIRVADLNTPVITRQADGGAADGSTGSGDPVSVEGTVRGAITDSNLKGARVEIVETGQTTATDDLGRFRFPAVAPGTYTLRISYLGRETIQETIDLTGGEGFSQGFKLSFATSIGVTSSVDVIGTRSARQQALNLERTAENSQTVISSDLLGGFTGQSISESLRRAPGIAFQQDPNTGDGTNVIIRGLEPDFNTVLFNGVELPEGSGVGRSASLGNILTDTVDSVVISKTLLPSQDSSGTGGLIEIETRSALDRDARFAQFSAELNERADGFAEGANFSGILSGKFGESENIGIGVSAQYRDRDFQTLTVANTLNYGVYLPLDSRGGTSFGRNPSGIPPIGTFPFDDTVGGNRVFPKTLTSAYRDQSVEDLSVGLNLDWEVADHTRLRFDAQRLETTTDRASADLFLAPAIFYILPQPVAELDGEVRPALRSFNFLTGGGGYQLNEDASQTTDTFSFRGETDFEQWSFTYNANYANGETATPRRTSINLGPFISFFDLGDDAFTDEAVDPIEGRIVTAFREVSPGDDNVPVNLFTADARARISNADSYRITNVNLSRLSGENERFGGDASARYNFQHDHLNYLEVGAFVEDSTFRDRRDFGDFDVGADETLTTLGFEFNRDIYQEIGVDSGIQFPSSDNVSAFFRSLQQLEAEGRVAINDPTPDPLQAGEFTGELESAAYVQSSVEFGPLEVIGGFRVSSYDVEARSDSRSFIGGDDGTDVAFSELTSELVEDKASQTEWLPRLLVNYRPTENTVARFGYFRTVARPQIGLLNDRKRFRLSLNDFEAGQVPLLDIEEGNEGLQPAITDNFDVSFERYFGDQGAVEVNLFYKRIENLLESNRFVGAEQLNDLVLPDFTQSTLYADEVAALGDLVTAANEGRLIVSRTQPQNADSLAYIWGLELSAEQQFTFLPGPWSGLGYYANYTYSDSSKDLDVPFEDPATGENFVEEIRDIRFDQQPEHSGTVALTYSKYGFDGNLIYSWQDRRLSSFQFNGLSNYVDEFESLDTRLVYTFDAGPGRYQVYFEGTDLLRDSDEPTFTTSSGDIDPGYITGRNYTGGREFRIGLVATF